MRTAARVMLLLLAGASLCAAQGDKKKTTARPDLSGRWLVESWQDEKGRTLPSVRGTAAVVVTHKEPELRVTRVRRVGGREEALESVYYTDGRGEKNMGPRVTDRPDLEAPHDQPVESRTKWKDDKLVTRGRMRQVLAGRTVEVETTDEWKVSADGQTLTQTVSTRLSVDDPGAAMPGQVPQGRVTFKSPGAKVYRTTYRRATE